MEPATEPPAALPQPAALAIRWWEALVLTLGAGLVVWAVTQALHPVFHVPAEYHIGMNAPVEEIKANQRAQNRVLRAHAMLYAGGLGLLLGAALGIRESMLRRSWLPLTAAPLAAA